MYSIASFREGRQIQITMFWLEIVNKNTIVALPIHMSDDTNFSLCETKFFLGNMSVIALFRTKQVNPLFLRRKQIFGV